MNRLLSLSCISFCLLILTGCFHKDTDNNGSYFVSSHAPTTIVTGNNTNNSGDDDKAVTDNNTNNNAVDDDKNDDDDKTDTPTNPTNPTNDDDDDVVSCDAIPGPINKFIRVQLTYGLLDEGAFIFGESGGLLPITITAPVNQDETIIPVDSTVSLVDGQILSYLGTNGRYSVGQIQSTTSNTITLTEPVSFALAADNISLWNFYDDAVHPNDVGFKALADYAFDTASAEFGSNQVHALLGDSWFRRNGVEAFGDRLLERLPSGSIIQNEGIGGNNLCDLLERVDNVINDSNPDYVWINSSINDFFAEVTQEQYKARMQTLIGRIQAAGAVAIVMDPAPGLLNVSTSDGVPFTSLSRRYASQILNLLAEAAE